MNKQDILNYLAEKKRVTVPVAAAEDWAGKARMSESGDCSCICLVYNKNTQNCRGDSPKLQREIPQ